MPKPLCKYGIAGRSISRNGEPFIYIDKQEGVRPVDADDAARKIVKLLNGKSCRPRKTNSEPGFR